MARELSTPPGQRAAAPQRSGRCRLARDAIQAPDPNRNAAQTASAPDENMGRAMGTARGMAMGTAMGMETETEMLAHPTAARSCRLMRAHPSKMGVTKTRAHPS